MPTLDAHLWTPQGAGYWYPIVGQTRLNRISPIAIDSPRQYLHWGHGKRIATYHLATMAMAYQSDDHPVDAWEDMCFDERRAKLYLLATVGSVRKVYTSGDGGRHIQEVLSVDAKSAVIGRDSERGYLIMLFQNTSDDILKRKISRDGGTTWDDPTNMIIDGASSTTGNLQGIAQDPRATGVLFATVKAVSDSTVKVYRSRDAGKNWTTVLS